MTIGWIPSRELTYPHLEKRKITFKSSPGYVVSRRVTPFANLPPMIFVGGWRHPLDKYARQIGSFPHFKRWKLGKKYEKHPLCDPIRTLPPMGWKWKLNLLYRKQVLEEPISNFHDYGRKESASKIPSESQILPCIKADPWPIDPKGDALKFLQLKFQETFSQGSMGLVYLVDLPTWMAHVYSCIVYLFTWMVDFRSKYTIHGS